MNLNVRTFASTKSGLEGLRDDLRYALCLLDLPFSLSHFLSFTCTSKFSLINRISLLLWLLIHHNDCNCFLYTTIYFFLYNTKAWTAFSFKMNDSYESTIVYIHNISLFHHLRRDYNRSDTITAKISPSGTFSMGIVTVNILTKKNSGTSRDTSREFWRRAINRESRSEK